MGAPETETKEESQAKESVGWRLSSVLMQKARAKAARLGVNITTYVTLLLMKDLEEDL